MALETVTVVVDIDRIRDAMIRSGRFPNPDPLELEPQAVCYSAIAHAVLLWMELADAAS